MVSPEERLKELGIKLHEAPLPLGSYLPCVRTGNLLYLSGVLPLRGGKLIRTGIVGDSISLIEAQEDAKQIIINALSIIAAYTGSIDTVARCVKLNGYIASAPDFTEQASVLNAASDLLYEVFGEKGKHARAAIGVYVLPLNSPLEIEFIFELTP